ncbi:Spore coat protein U (SCPU) domain-containing protein [Kushneria avicenniae]|uniref:Spore coat protein U (SCPU) domain-containing protein n=2 Tax=Kushneria avicenniae TaxID=402385 RepID=A0A1I1LH84_9GAMM|nr:Spore coat protein U (SCPU) domain-containing protein [Kushneria avicenniae]
MAGLNQYSHAAQESFDVSAIVTPGCLVQGGSAQGGRWGVLDFGRHSALSQAVVTTSLTPSESIRLQCTRGLSLSMSVNQGQHYNSGTRQLQNAEGGQVGYRLYSDSARSDELLPGQATSLMAPEDGTDLQLPLYGRLQLGPNVPPGTYTDQLVVTLSW